MVGCGNVRREQSRESKPGEQSKRAIPREPVTSNETVDKLYNVAHDVVGKLEKSQLEEVRALGCYPKYCKQTKTIEQKRKHDLRRRLDDNKSSISQQSLVYLSALGNSATRQHAQKLMQKTITIP